MSQIGGVCERTSQEPRRQDPEKGVEEAFLNPLIMKIYQAGLLDRNGVEGTTASSA
jgi:hypothetical protein